MLDIHHSYRENGAEFRLALSDADEVIATIGLMCREKNCAMRKKFFGKKEYRTQKVGIVPYRELPTFVCAAGVRQILPDL